jgi:SAM-dependent methyltransferase
MQQISALPVTPGRLMQLTGGFGPPLVVEAAIRLRIFNLLDQGAKDLDEIVSATGASARGLRALLNALVGLDLLTKSPDGRYGLTAESAAFLVSDKPTFHGAFFLLTSEAMLPNWGQLTEIVRSGRPTQRINLEDEGSKFFLRFVENIFPIHFPGARQLAEALGVASASAPLPVLDLAAGSGVWSIALAKQSPHVRVTAVDWPAVISVTRKVTLREGVADRFRFVEGDLLEADFGSGYSIATAGHILHSEGEERSRLLLNKTFDALAPGGTIAIAEILVDRDRTGPLPALMFAVNMLVNSEHGNTFSLEEISEWLRDAGFQDVRTVEAPGLAPLLILATKPSA